MMREPKSVSDQVLLGKYSKLAEYFLARDKAKRDSSAQAQAIARMPDPDTLGVEALRQHCTMNLWLPPKPRPMPDEVIVNMKRIEAIIFSMTRQERRNPDIIKGRRKERIAKGSGTQLQDVTALVSQFKQMQRMMKKIGGGGKGGQIDPRDLMRRLR